VLTPVSRRPVLGTRPAWARRIRQGILRILPGTAPTGSLCGPRGRVCSDPAVAPAAGTLCVRQAPHQASSRQASSRQASRQASSRQASSCQASSRLGLSGEKGGWVFLKTRPLWEYQPPLAQWALDKPAGHGRASANCCAAQDE
jgi:hypothetical protein